MADIVPSLFGVTPQMYQQQQQDRMDAQALQYAKLDPFQRANFAIGRGANMLGGAIGGALGGQDPELQRITLRQQIASQIDFTDPASIQQGMNALGDDVMGKQQLAQIYRQQRESGALIAQRTAAATRERAPTGDVAKGMRVNEITRALQTPEISDLERIGLEAELKSLSPAKAKEPTTNEITNAAAFAATKGEPGTPAYTAAFQSKHSELIAPKEAKGPSFGADREAVAGEMFNNQTFAQLTPTQKAVVNKRVDDENKSKAKAGAPTFALPGQTALADIPAFRAKVQSTIDPQLKAVNAADQALEAIETSLATGNFVSFNAARVQLAKALGDSQLSKRDVEQAGGDPSLLGGFADLTSKLFTSTPTVDTQNKIKQTLEAIRKVAARKATTEVEQQRKIALRSPGYDAGAVTEALTFSELTPRAAAATAVAPQYATNPQTKERIMSTDGGKTWTPVR
jgi:hypothetical protein